MRFPPQYGYGVRAVKSSSNNTIIHCFRLLGAVGVSLKSEHWLFRSLQSRNYMSRRHPSGESRAHTAQAIMAEQQSHKLKLKKVHALHQKSRSSNPLVSVLVWGIHHTVRMAWDARA